MRLRWGVIASVALASTVLPIAGAAAGTAAPSGHVTPAASADGRWEKLSASINGTYIPIMGQFDCDADNDPHAPSTSPPDEQAGIVLYAPGTGLDYLWTDLGASGTTLTKTQTTFSVTGTYTPVEGDFDGDGCSDILWYAPGNAVDSIWWGGPTGFTPGVHLTINGTYIALSGSYTSDARRDIFWYAPNGTESIWQGTGDRAVPFDGAAAPQVGGSSYRPATAVNGQSGGDEIFWYGPGAIPDSVWHYDFSGVMSQRSTTLGGSYLPLSCGTSVVLYGDSAPSKVWNLSGTSYVTYDISIGPGYRAAASGMDNRCSVIWHRPGAASDAVWLDVNT